MTHKELSDFFESIPMSDIDSLVFLQMRWNDERQYEDWKDYEDEIKKRFSKYNVEKVTKRPFGFTFKVKTTVLRLSVTSKSVNLDVVTP